MKTNRYKIGIFIVAILISNRSIGMDTNNKPDSSSLNPLTAFVMVAGQPLASGFFGEFGKEAGKECVQRIFRNSLTQLELRHKTSVNENLALDSKLKKLDIELKELEKENQELKNHRERANITNGHTKAVIEYCTITGNRKQQENVSNKDPEVEEQYKKLEQEGVQLLKKLSKILSDQDENIREEFEKAKTKRKL